MPNIEITEEQLERYAAGKSITLTPPPKIKHYVAVRTQYHAEVMAFNTINDVPQAGAKMLAGGTIGWRNSLRHDYFDDPQFEVIEVVKDLTV